MGQLYRQLVSPRSILQALIIRYTRTELAHRRDCCEQSTPVLKRVAAVGGNPVAPMALAHGLCCARKRIATKRLSRPRGDGLALGIRPSLASWMPAGHPDQVRLEMFLAHVEGLALPLIKQVDHPGPSQLFHVDPRRRLDHPITPLQAVLTGLLQRRSSAAPLHPEPRRHPARRAATCPHGHDRTRTHALADYVAGRARTGADRAGADVLAAAAAAR